MTFYRRAFQILIISLVAVWPLWSEETFTDVTALIKPDLFPAQVEGTPRAWGVMAGRGPEIIKVENLRNATSAEIILIEAPKDAALQPDTLYLSSVAADSIGLVDRSCFVNVSYTGVIPADDGTYDYSAQDSATAESEKPEGDGETDNTDTAQTEDTADSELPEAATEEGIQITGEEPDTGITEDPEYKEDLPADNQIVQEPEADKVEDSPLSDYSWMFTDAVDENDTALSDKADTESDLFADTNQNDTVQIDPSDHVTDPADSLITDSNTLSELPLDDQDTIYFLEPSDFRPPEGETESVGKIGEERGKDSVALPPIREGRALTELEPGRISSAYLPKGIYIQVGAFSEKRSLSRTRTLLGSFSWPMAEISRDAGNGREMVRLLVGPFKRDEVGVVLYKIRNSGYADAFIMEHRD